MLLVDNLPLITDYSDIEHYIERFRRWNADDNKDVSPVFPRDLLGFVIRLIDNLSLYVKQQDNPVSPTIADSVEKVCIKSKIFPYQAYVNLRITIPQNFTDYHTATRLKLIALPRLLSALQTGFRAVQRDAPAARTSPSVCHRGCQIWRLLCYL